METGQYQTERRTQNTNTYKKPGKIDKRIILSTNTHRATSSKKRTTVKQLQEDNYNKEYTDNSRDRTNQQKETHNNRGDNKTTRPRRQPTWTRWQPK